jgi:hypothetical protein
MLNTQRSSPFYPERVSGWHVKKKKSAGTQSQNDPLARMLEQVIEHE